MNGTSMRCQAVCHRLLAGFLALIPAVSPLADHCAPASVPETIMGLPLIAEHRTGVGVEAVYVQRTEWLWYSARQSEGVVCPYPCPLSAYLPPEVEFGLVDPQKWSANFIACGDTYVHENFSDPRSSERFLTNKSIFDHDDHCVYSLRYAVIHGPGEVSGASDLPSIFEETFTIHDMP